MGGADLAGWGSGRRANLTSLLSNLVVLHSTATVCARWAEARVARGRQPIAAAALAHGLELVTHNPADFRGVPGLTAITEAP